MTLDRRGALALAFVMTAGARWPVPALAEERLARLLVLDFEIVDTSNEPVDQRADHARRLARLRDDVAARMAEQNIFEVVDRAAIESDIAAILAQQYFRTCNGCELTLGKKARADLVMTGQVNKVSTLIMSMEIWIKRVSTGELVYFQNFDFRGDNDQSWTRAAKYVVERIAREPLR